MLLTSCYDEKMEWGRPADYNDVVSSEIPLSLREKIANYKEIKTYMDEYMPETPLAVGLGAAKYLADSAYAAICDNNYEQFVTGNAMKHQSLVANDGSLRLAPGDELPQFLNAISGKGIELYGHNLIWHTQQNSVYLKSLIAPKMVVESDGDIANILTNGDFETGSMSPWGSWGNGSTSEVKAGAGVDGSYGLQLVNPTDGSDYYVAQLAYTLNEPLEAGKTYVMRFKAKGQGGATSVQFATQNSSTYAGEGYRTMDFGSDWTTCECEYTCTKDGMNRILINFGKYAGTILLDNVEFGEKAKASQVGAKASKVTYVLKTPEEKREALLGAMESWIKGVTAAVASAGVKQWEVINEPIANGTNLWRGVDKGTWMDGDAEPTEDTQNGLNLNWADGHFYWGYYLGRDYAPEAFKLARKYAADGCKLYVNEYGLETSAPKTAALVKFVEYIDANGGKVDGIGTQMHVSYNVDSASVAQMFKTLAATGKLVRISELDVKLNTSTPTADQLQQQSDCYRMIINSYKANVPAAQRGGLCIWGVSDAEDEHTYWIPNDAPNLFDAQYKRKTAYKGVCDGIAGKDISAGFKGDDWTNVYE